MRFTADDLIPVPINEMSHYECAVDALRSIAAEGFVRNDETVPPGQRQSVFIGKNRKPLVHLVEAAMQAVDPESCAYYNEGKGIMQLEFSTAFEKPPIRLVWAKLDELRETMMRQSKLDPGGEYYVVSHDEKSSLDLCRFAAIFASPDHQICFYYKLPATEPFTDANGQEHLPNSPVNYDVMEQYLQAHSDENLPPLDQMQPIRTALDKHTMQQVLDAMGVTAQQRGSSRN